jgi:predicted nucleic acid-binding protein
MSGFDIVVDTNILIYLTSGNKHIAESTRGKNLSISFITEMELRSWPSLTTGSSQTIKNLLSQCRIISLSEEIKETAIEIRRKTKLKLPDSIICSTAIYLGLPLLSSDQALKKVKELDLLLITL